MPLRQSCHGLETGIFEAKSGGVVAAIGNVGAKAVKAQLQACMLDEQAQGFAAVTLSAHALEHGYANLGASVARREVEQIDQPDAPLAAIGLVQLNHQAQFPRFKNATGLYYILLEGKAGVGGGGRGNVPYRRVVFYGVKQIEVLGFKCAKRNHKAGVM